MRVDILGMPFNGDGTSPEGENPAQGLRDTGLIRLLRSSGQEVQDLGELPEFLNHWLSSGKVIGMSLACYHPRLDG